MKYHITEFTAILAAYAAGQTVHWKHEGYSLAGGPDPDSIVVQYPANGHCCGLFHADGENSSYDPADFQIVPVQGMKYYDNQDARTGDTFTLGTFGTCRITELQDGLAIVRNVSTREVFELDSLSEADLIDREPMKTALDIRRDFKAV